MTEDFGLKKLDSIGDVSSRHPNYKVMTSPSDMRLPGLMRSKQSAFDRVSDKPDLIREVQNLRN